MEASSNGLTSIFFFYPNAVCTMESVCDRDEFYMLNNNKSTRGLPCETGTNA